jgi:osmotically-inducible protein OsmY
MNKISTKLAALAAIALIGVAGCASKPGQNNFFDDAMVTTRVKKAIFDDPSLKVTDVSVTTENAVVSLSGTVKSRADRTRATEVARRVDGVKLVKNELKVDPRAAK